MDFDTSANPSQADELSAAPDRQIVRATLTEVRRCTGRQMYALAIDGVVIVERSANPEFDAAASWPPKASRAPSSRAGAIATTTRCGSTSRRAPD